MSLANGNKLSPNIESLLKGKVDKDELRILMTKERKLIKLLANQV